PRRCLRACRIGVLWAGRHCPAPFTKSRHRDFSQPILARGHRPVTERNIVTTKFFRWLAPAIPLAVLFTCNPARAQTYRVAHASDGFVSFEYALINNSGVVVFTALRRDPSSGTVFYGVYKGRGGQISTVAEAPAFSPPPPGAILPTGVISINSAGLVAFYGTRGGFTTVYLAGPNIAVQPVDNARGGPLAITDSGFLAYGATIRGPFPDLFTSDPTVYPCDSCAGHGRVNKRNQYLVFLGNQIGR